MSTPIVFLDCEPPACTPTAARGDRHDPREGDRQRSLTIYVSDVDLSSAELIGLRVGRFHDRHPMYRKDVGGAFDIDTESDDTVDPWAADDQLGVDHCLYPEQHAAVTVERWTRGAHIVGAVPNFDTECLAAMLRRHGLCPAWHHHLIDVEALAVATSTAPARSAASPFRGSPTPCRPSSCPAAQRGRAAHRDGRCPLGHAPVRPHTGGASEHRPPPHRRRAAARRIACASTA
ncbi:hypothetical protein [Nocardia sp. FDAARGOS_372]|uniref:hypothetical protein n=1 Tax=Nocardia sp. FDAARGOS_372 TaxID=2018066 RepID=UPI000FDC9347|nr:hypothetical protein [Nocardia sp. FDAARGOS_372]